MFSYQHRYHAGGFADVHKHLALIAILMSLSKKTTPFCVLDAYAGEGIYPLHSPESQKTKEYLQGAWPLFQATSPPSDPLLHRYWEEIQRVNETSDKIMYPGSSAIIASFLREQDRGIVVEKHPQAIQALRMYFNDVRHIHIHERDAEEAMIALVPFREKRGLILVDPSYEVKTEYSTLPTIIQQVHQRFSQAIIAIWYPILPTQAHRTLLTLLQEAHFRSTLIHEWSPPQIQQTMKGSGLFIINPPFLLKEQLDASLILFPIWMYGVLAQGNRTKEHQQTTL